MRVLCMDARKETVWLLSDRAVYEVEIEVRAFGVSVFRVVWFD